MLNIKKSIMKTVNYKDDYFKTLLEGEGETISWAEAVAAYSLREAAPEGNTLLLRFDETDSEGNPDANLFSLYDIQFVNGRYFIVKQTEERLSHGLGKAISDAYKTFARSEKSFQWWSSLVIGNTDGTLYLSDLTTELKMPLCDEIMIPFSEFLDELTKLVSRWKVITAGSYSSVILSSSEPAFVSLPLRFAIQEVFGCPVSVLPGKALEEIDLDGCDDLYLVSRGILDKNLSLSPSVSVAEVIKEGSVSFMTPVDGNFNFTAILGAITLGDLFGETPQADFTAGDISLKRVTLRFRKTGYGRILMSAEGGARLLVGVPSKSGEIFVVATSLKETKSEGEIPPKVNTPKDEGLRLKGFSLKCGLPNVGSLRSMSEEQLLAEKERLTSAIDFDVITADTNIFLCTSKKDDAPATMFYAPMILSLAKLQHSKNPSGSGFEVNSAVQEEIYRFQCGKFSDDSAWERSRNCSHAWGRTQDKIDLKLNARKAVRMLDSLASENQVCSSPDTVNAEEGKVYADPFIVKRCMEIISQGKSLMLISDDTDLRYKVKVAAQRYCEAHPGIRKPAVLSGGQVFPLISCLHKIEKELSSRSVSVAC